MAMFIGQPILDFILVVKKMKLGVNRFFETLKHKTKTIITIVSEGFFASVGWHLFNILISNIL